MSRRQNERNSRFLLDIDRELRAASAAFRDNDLEASTAVAVRLHASVRWTDVLGGIVPRSGSIVDASAKSLTAAG